MLVSFYIKPVVVSKIGKGRRIFGFCPEAPLGVCIYTTRPSLEVCTNQLSGWRFENKIIVSRRIDKKELEHGYYLQSVPFKSDFKS
jgi:hypothetical protein